MDSSIYKYIKPGIIHFMAYPETMRGNGPILESLEKICADDFFRAIEITWISDDRTREIARELLKQSHLEIKYAAQPRLLTQKLDLNSFDEKERKKAIEDIKRGIDEAKYMNATGLALLSGKYPDRVNGADDKKEEAKKILVDSLLMLCDYAGDLPLALEIFDSDIDKKALIGKTSDASAIAKNVKKSYKTFGLLVDLSHIPLLGEGIEQSILPIKDHIVHCHIGNCVLSDKTHPAYGDKHPRFGIDSGENDVNEVAEFLKVLKKTGFYSEKKQGVVSFEVSPMRDERSEIIIANSKRVLLDAWQKV